jgi:uncharacterized protein (DUF433 family)
VSDKSARVWYREVAPDHKDLSIYGGCDPRELPNYTVALAAHHLLLPVSTLRDWVFGAEWIEKNGRVRRFDPLIKPPSDNPHRLLSFLNLIEAHVLKGIRRKQRVKMAEVREAIEFLAAKYRTNHPLADVDLWASGSDLFIEEVGQLINVTKRQQLAFHDLLKAHLERIDRTVEDPHGPARLYPFTAEPVIVGSTVIVPQFKTVSIDPFVSFGRPVIAGTNVRTEILVERFFAGDTIDELAEEHHMDRLKIEEAIRYERAFPPVEAPALP